MHGQNHIKFVLNTVWTYHMSLISDVKFVGGREP